MKNKRSRKLDLKRGVISNLERINGGLKQQPSGTGDTVLCVSRPPYCTSPQES
ncbi:hypothetical protein [Kordia sp.]|uniref:hypothetical protein n=1 Tax=Kordia sp. TaxID=1965332 RepID=UPI003D6C6686